MKCKILIFVIVAVVFISGVLPLNIVYGSTSYNIDATVKISVCGNGVVEGGEDCDSMNLNGKTCQNLKSEEGSLSCDISCSFDTSQCVAVAPTQMQSLFLAPTMELDSRFPPSLKLRRASRGNDRRKIHRTTSFRSVLPPALDFFDISKNGHLMVSELPDILKMWILSWKNYSEHKECDLTGNGACDMKDLSVLLYYVNR